MSLFPAPQNFKREEQNFVVQNEINNMSFLTADSKSKMSKVRRRGGGSHQGWGEGAVSLGDLRSLRAKGPSPREAASVLCATLLQPLCLARAALHGVSREVGTPWFRLTCRPLANLCRSVSASPLPVSNLTAILLA